MIRFFKPRKQITIRENCLNRGDELIIYGNELVIRDNVFSIRENELVIRDNEMCNSRSRITVCFFKKIDMFLQGFRTYGYESHRTFEINVKFFTIILKGKIYLNIYPLKSFIS